MSKFLLVAVCCAFILASCHPDTVSKPKETYEDSILLLSIVDSAFFIDEFKGSTTTRFQHDNAGELSVWSYEVKSDEYENSYYNVIERDNLERVMKITRSISTYSVRDQKYLPKPRNQIYAFHYQGNAKELLFCYRYDEGTAPETGDSITLTYNGSNITSMNVYRYFDPGPRDYSSATIWDYDGAGQIISTKGVPQNSYTLGTYTYEYDGKTNPQKVGLEVIVGDPLRMSAGNVVRQVSTYSQFDKQFITTTDYVYRDYDRPLKATVTTEETGEKHIVWYGYSR